MPASVMLVSQSAPAASAGAGGMGLFILLAMGLATALLVANMNRRLKRLPRSYDEAADPVASAAAPATHVGAGLKG